MVGVEFARAAHDPTIPATHYEGERLRQAAGLGPYTGGTNPPGMTNKELLYALKARYGFSAGITIGTSFAGLWAALPVGHVASITGKLGVFPVGHRLRRWAGTFDGYHKMFLYRYSTADEAWWCDPLAPTGVGYSGERVTKAEVKLFVEAAIAAGGAWMAAPLVATPKTTISKPVSFTPNRGLSYKAGTRRWKPSGEVLPAMQAAGRSETDGLYTFTQSDGRAPNGSGFAKLLSGGSAGLYIGQFTLDPLPEPAPAPEPEPFPLPEPPPDPEPEPAPTPAPLPPLPFPLDNYDEPHSGATPIRGPTKPI